MRFWIGLFAVCVFVSFAAPVEAQNAIFVLYADGVLSRVDLSTGAVVSSRLPFEASRFDLANDGETVIVLRGSPGSLDLKSPQAFRPVGAKGAAVLVRDGKVLEEAPLGWGLAHAAIPSNGTAAYVLSFGYDTDVARDAKPAELTTAPVLRSTRESTPSA